MTYLRAAGPRPVTRICPFSLSQQQNELARNAPSAFYMRYPRCSIAEIGTLTSTIDVAKLHHKPMYTSSMSQEIRCMDFNSAHDAESDTERRGACRIGSCVAIVQQIGKNKRDNEEKKSKIDINIEFNDERYNLQFKKNLNKTNLTIQNIGRCCSFDKTASNKDPRVVKSLNVPTNRTLPSAHWQQGVLQQESKNEMHSLDAVQLHSETGHVSRLAALVTFLTYNSGKRSSSAAVALEEAIMWRRYIDHAEK
ncbi:hypothetical protein EVAR_24347_1 [Eumeta japonica]|uniref:Uncharacterized protein n=1 Tax=Eumeta variegata TaxID=151549 RepID=A0A4C1VNL5_EUMVA|nr:hypothetical protein EVAR_24347_1 [Eumeta japonica]